MLVGLCSIELNLPGVSSLKEKRAVLKGLTVKIHNKFNVSIAEVDYQDYWQKAILGVAAISNENRHLQQVLQQVVNFIEKSPEVILLDYHLEIL
ncbi:MAG: DUF503 domain-containing protein [Bacillota bacterium]